MSDDPQEAETIDDLTPEEIEALRDPNNAGNPVAVRAKEKSTKRQDRMLREMISGMLDVPHGRLFLGWLIVEVCGLYSPLADAQNSTEGLQHREGSRRVGLIMDALGARAGGDRYMRMLLEHRTNIGNI